MQVKKKLTRGRTFRHIFSLDDSLRLVADDVLIQSIRSFRSAVGERKQESAAEEDTWYYKEVRRTLAEMEAEARRRGLSLPEDTRLDGLAGPS